MKLIGNLEEAVEAVDSPFYSQLFKKTTTIIDTLD